MTRRAGALLLVCAAAASIVVLPLARGEVFTFRDHTDYFQPLRFHTAQHLRALRLPLWNPYSASGEPWLANPQTGVFYPPTWLFVLLPFERAYMSYLFLHLALLGSGFFVLFARFARTGAAATGAVGVMFCGPTLSMLDVQNNLATLAWLPWALTGAFELRREASLRTSLRTAIVLALAFLGGEPFLAALSAAGCAVVIRRIRTIAFVAVMSFGLSAVQLFPFVEMLMTSDRRAGMSADDVLRESMPPADWLRVAVPPRTGSGAFDPALSQHYIPVVYLGVTIVLLALGGVAVLAQRRSWRTLLLFGGGIAAAMIVAAGPRLLADLPLTPFRHPARVVPLAAFAIVALAVIALDRLPARWTPIAIGIAMVAELWGATAPLRESAAWRRDRVPFARSLGRDAKFLRIGADGMRLGSAREAWIAGYLNLYDGRFDAWTAAPMTSQRYRGHYERALADPAVARRMSVGYVLSPHALPGGRFVPAGRAAGVFAYRVGDALPLAYVIAGDEAIGPLSLSFGPSHVDIEVSTPRGGLLVVTQNDAEGWSVRVDGIRRAKRRAGALFRAVEIPPGRHSVRWSYAPASLTAGLAVTFLTVAGAVFAVRARRSLR